VLLKNEGNLLPLDQNALKTVAVIGPNANNRKALVGNYEGTASRYVTILEGIQDYLADSSVRVFYSEGCHLFKDRVSGLGERGDRFAEVKAVCAEADVVIVCTGLDSGLEGEEGDQGNEFASGDKQTLTLPGLQEELVQIAKASGKPVIVVNLSGSAIALNYADESVSAIIQGWYPGAQGGKAIAETIFGKCAPQGKLPLTFYRTTEELPSFTDYSMKNRTYRYMKNEALYPFGYGLTYSDYELSNVAASDGKITEAGLELSAVMKNTGSRELCETLQVYVGYDGGGEHTPNPQLKSFQKIKLQPGESQTLKVVLPLEAFSLADENGDFFARAGEYSVYVGCSQPDSRSVSLTNKKPVQLTACIEETYPL